MRATGAANVSACSNTGEAEGVTVVRCRPSNERLRAARAVKPEPDEAGRSGPTRAVSIVEAAGPRRDKARPACGCERLRPADMVNARLARVVAFDALQRLPQGKSRRL
jgi:hypothetical protein